VTKQTSSPGSKNGFYLLLGAIVVFAAVAVALLAWLSETGGGSNLSDAEAQELLEGIPQSGTTLGKEGAPVKIQLYEDFQCPACAQFNRESYPDLVEGYVKPGEVKLVSETLAFLGPDSVATGRAALAAGEQDRYWNYAALLFLNQGSENSGYATDEFLRRLANETRELDVSRWDEARRSGSVRAELEAVQTRAEADGVDSTPTLIVTGPGGTRKLVGAVSIEMVEAAIEEVGGS
jgi:protein-disulfide isomerase